MRIYHVLLLLQAATALFAPAAGATTTTGQRPRVDGGVHRTLRRQATINLMVTMKDDTTQVLESVQQKEASFATRGEKISHMVSQLERHTMSSQQEITAMLAQESTTGNALASEVRSFWISNQLFFRDATFALVEKLSKMPSVASIDEEMIFTLPVVPVNTHGNATVTSPSIAGSAQWGVAKIQAPDVWARGTTGEGVVVGIMDTGVRASHEALRSNFRKAFGWYDPEKNATDPYDSGGHGTHVMGTIVGASGYGVAPGATWITCKGCRVRSCSQSDTLACAQFFTCPTDPTGTIKDCSKAPRIVSNSWGGPSSQQFFRSAIAAWHLAGIIPVFSIGNNGPACSTTGSPGIYANAIGVGATDESDSLTSFSSKGPTVDGRVKPDISAPGEEVVSASWDSDTAYTVMSGTSMAAPHVAGVVALLLSAEPTLTFDQVLKRLTDTTDQSLLKPADIVCGGTENGVFPNNMYGHGRVNALSVIDGHRAPQPAPTTPAPTPTPTRMPGQCGGIVDAEECERVFFCSWNARGQRCQRWWY